MPAPTDPREWPPRVRFPLAGTVGACWSLLWIGLAVLTDSPRSFLAFLVLTVVLFSPVLAALSDRWVDLVAHVGIATVVAAFGSLAALELLGHSPPRSPDQLVALMAALARAWLPLAVASLAIWAARRRRRIARPPAD